jgi:5-(carboxyamino)imidazole ribonucleotide mutase
MTNPIVGVIMGSDSDWAIMRHAAARLAEFGIPYEARVISAHRTPDLACEYAEQAEGRGLQCIIAGAGGAAHLAGVLAAKTVIPVLAVPMPSRHLQGLDSLLAIVQMPTGVPVATFAIGEAGAHNAALFVVATFARHDEGLARRLRAFRDAQSAKVQALVLPDLP